jgi:hypothetical protein
LAPAWRSVTARILIAFAKLEHLGYLPQSTGDLVLLQVLLAEID